LLPILSVWLKKLDKNPSVNRLSIAVSFDCRKFLN
jgi:hypothetical protein